MGGLARVYITHGVFRDAAAIAASLFLIVLASILLGTALPFALSRVGVDPAHAGSSVQVGSENKAVRQCHKSGKLPAGHGAAIRATQAQRGPRAHDGSSIQVMKFCVCVPI